MSLRYADRVGIRSACAVMVLLLALGNTAPAAEAYYLLMFGSQRTPNEPNYSHSFATFVRAHWVSPAAPRLEVQTISWMPRDLRIRAFALTPQSGVNLDLPASLRNAYANGERVSLWGPYQIHRDLYWRAAAQARSAARGTGTVLAGVPRALPALTRAAKLGRRAARPTRVPSRPARSSSVGGPSVWCGRPIRI